MSIYLVNSRILKVLTWGILYLTPFCTCAHRHLCVCVYVCAFVCVCMYVVLDNCITVSHPHVIITLLFSLIIRGFFVSGFSESIVKINTSDENNYITTLY